MSLPKALRSIVDEFLALDVGDRSDYLIEFAESYRRVPDSIALPPYDNAHKVPGCESEVFLWVVLPEGGSGSVELYAAVENPQGISAMAMASILQHGIAGGSIQEVLSIPEDLVFQFFGRGLSMGKGQGLMSMIGVMKVLLQDELKALC